MLKKAIKELIEGHNLTHKECEEVIKDILVEENESQIAAFLVLMRSKGETAEELFGIVQAAREQMVHVALNEPVLDIVGTGGDGSNSINISTGSSLLAAACGVKVAKHGNRASSSQCGSADVLEAMGLKIEIPPQEVVQMINEIGIGFMFAPFYHPTFKGVTRVRRKLGIRTLFNFIGPLLNPAEPSFHLLGVATKKLLDLLADVIFKLKTKRSILFHCQGMDELTPIAVCDVIEVTDKKKICFELDPEKFGLKKCTKKDLEGGGADLNAKLLVEALSGQGGPIADTFILNAGVAIYVYGLAESIAEGIENARIVQKSGKAVELVEKWKTF